MLLSVKQIQELRQRHFCLSLLLAFCLATTVFGQAISTPDHVTADYGYETRITHACPPPDHWQVLPAGLMYSSYLAGEKEPRVNAVWLKDRSGKLNWETQLGGRVGLLRYGNSDVVMPQGWQFDVEGGAQTRVLPNENSDLESADFRIGFVVTNRRGYWATKHGYYHLSSHLGDEFLIKHPATVRLNYVRDSAIFGLSRDLLLNGSPDARLYGEIAYALNHEYGEPLELQFGIEYSPCVFNDLKGSPFFAINGHLREDREWKASSINVVGGWQWRSAATNHRFRIGTQYYEGPSIQWSFVEQHERLIGSGMWFDY